MRDVLIAIVQTIPTALSAFAAIVRWGEDDEERMAKLEETVGGLQSQLQQVMDLIQEARHKEGT
jgi:hypothetical protein